MKNEGFELNASPLRVWIANVAPCFSEELYWNVLSSAERLKYQQFRFEPDRLRYLTTRAMVRVVLSNHMCAHPGSIEFEFNDCDKPVAFLKGSGLRRFLNFNVSHTDDLVALVVGFDQEIGIDLVRLTDSPAMEVAEDVFSNSENALIQKAPCRLSGEIFWKLWAIKESYTKAIGEGLSYPFKELSIDFLLNEEVATVVMPGGRVWNFRQMRIDGGYFISIFLSGSGHDSVEYSICQFSDLVVDWTKF